MVYLLLKLKDQKFLVVFALDTALGRVAGSSYWSCRVLFLRVGNGDRRRPCKLDFAWLGSVGCLRGGEILRACLVDHLVTLWNLFPHTFCLIKIRMLLFGMLENSQVKIWTYKVCLFVLGAWLGPISHCNLTFRPRCCFFLYQYLFAIDCSGARCIRLSYLCVLTFLLRSFCCLFSLSFVILLVWSQMLRDKCAAKLIFCNSLGQQLRDSAR